MAPPATVLDRAITRYLTVNPGRDIPLEHHPRAIREYALLSRRRYPLLQPLPRRRLRARFLLRQVPQHSQSPPPPLATILANHQFAEIVRPCRSAGGSAMPA